MPKREPARGLTLNRLSDRSQDTKTLARLARAAGLLLLIFVCGTVGYYLLGKGEFSLLQCVFMTTITLTSIGYGEVIPIAKHPDRMVFTIALVIMGMGTALYFVSQLTAFIVDGDLRDLLYHTRMNRKRANLSDHFIVAGIGSTGRHVIEEIARSQQNCIMIDEDLEVLRSFQEEIERSTSNEVTFIRGDATSDEVLRGAGIERAKGIVFTLGNDRDNLFATITARSLNSELLIITRGDDPESKQKFIRAGATSVIYTNVLGGLRMAAEVIRPEVTGFLDLMMHDHGEVRRIEELNVPPNSPLIGKKLREVPLRRYSDALVIATYDKVNEDYTFNPGPDYEFSDHMKLILLVRVDDVPKIEALLNGKLR